MVYDPIIVPETANTSSSCLPDGTVKVAIRLRIHPPKRRSPGQRLRSRLYYRRNRARIRMQRRRYLRTHRSIIKHRKMFMRYKPSWFKKMKKPHKGKIRIEVPKSKRPKSLHFKLFKPSKPKVAPPTRFRSFRLGYFNSKRPKSLHFKLFKPSKPKVAPPTSRRRH